MNLTVETIMLLPTLVVGGGMSYAFDGDPWPTSVVLHFACFRGTPISYLLDDMSGFSLN